MHTATELRSKCCSGHQIRLILYQPGIGLGQLSGPGPFFMYPTKSQKLIQAAF